jgi:tetratricopeptide (TPR) repeat protein
MHTSRRNVLIIVLLLLLVLGPILIAGYADLSLAEASPVAHDQSVYYESAARRLPWRADLYELAGLAAIQAGEYERAVSLFRSAAEKGVLTPGGRFELGRAHFFTGDQQKAIAEWESLLSDGQTRGIASQHLADVYHFNGQFDDEEQILRQWLEFDPANADAQYGLGLLLFADASPEALPLLESAAANSPALKAHVDGLIRSLKMALDDSSTSTRLTLCGQTLAAIGEWRLSERTFQRAVQADPQNGLAWAWLGEARQQTGNDDPFAAFQQALAFSPDAADIRAMFGLYWQRRREWQKALAEFETAARLEPQKAVWQMSLGGVYVHLGDLVKALEYYQAAVDLAPKDPQAWRALALFSVENDVDIEGIGRAAALQAYALEPENAQGMDILGRTLMDTEQWDAAEALFKKAIAAAPQDAAPVFHLALLYLQTGKPDLAKQHLQSAQTLDPNGPIGTQAANVLARYFP